jgi:hypothetical protein
VIPFEIENNPDATITGLPVYQMMTFLTWLMPQIIAVAVYQILVALNSTTFSKRLMHLKGLKRLGFGRAFGRSAGGERLSSWKCDATYIVRVYLYS